MNGSDWLITANTLLAVATADYGHCNKAQTPWLEMARRDPTLPFTNVLAEEMGRMLR